jgi:hypothetical protein
MELLSRADTVGELLVDEIPERPGQNVAEEALRQCPNRTADE